ncbi:hypothetical protein ABFS82_10G033500 [Erythranthe guttata]|uniref:uncharacterized protein LOC105952946 isoform X1 n=2 Tax=Erythranthe guttata TaxID=4155 RepID=UPI00064E0F29|nr:PREDICTED: uncharacterized protein LOC105952946 isoform X1 [Erythranthe guttata]|eukprot:XP_012831998.1 PREDICTED: uncharacterized protein LOC105952946 isoform X1 [Erythranthe guttata]
MRSPARIMWAARLHSAVRAALACAVVGGATLYGPTFITDQIKFPAFSYVTVILITFDAATVLGGSLRGCWHAFCATAQVVPPAMAGRWLAGDKAGLSIWMAALATAAASFVIVLPESTHLTAKRIALGQLVLACTEAVITSDESSSGFMHPLHIAASTALGALASVSALLLPFPRLAHYEVEKLRRVYAENARERMNLYLRAFKANNNRTKTELLLQAKPFAETGNKLLQNITILQEVVWWERPWSHYVIHDLISIEDRLRSTELTMRGIEYSLVYSQTCTPDNQEQLSSVLDSISCQLHHEIEHAILQTEAAAHEKRRGSTFIEKNLSSQLAPIQNKHEWLCFFFSCKDILLNDTNENRKPQTQPQKTEFTITEKIKNWIFKLTRSDRLESALKCSISLGLAVVTGLMLERENGCWASLTLATGFSIGKQPFFTTANSRAQGTAVGSVYGVICCFIFRYLELRLVSLLPWIVFSVFIRHSRMYGQTGGISAAIGASLILGRKKYGAPTEFAIARITAVFVGLLCLLLVELLMQPNRAATLAKRQLYLTLEALKNSLNETGSRRVSKFLQAREKNQRKLETLFQELRKSVADADSEPDFWCLPFQTTCYKKVVASLSCIENMLYFLELNLDLVSETLRHELNEQVNNELELLQESVNSLLKYLDNASSIKSRDIEAGKSRNSEKVNALVVEYEDKENEKRRQGEWVVRCIGAIGFCIGSIRKEIDNVEICVKEIVQWENFSTK